MRGWHLEACHENIYNAVHAWCALSQVITVEYGSNKVLLTRGKHPTVDGMEVNLDSGFHKSPLVTVTYNQVMTLLLFNNGLSILYDGGRVRLQ